MLFLVIFFLAFWAGFSARRASVCLVRATHEIIEHKPLKTLFFILQAMVVALSITIPAMLMFPDKISLAPSYSVSWPLFLGAFFYGVGASLNKACALGTLNELMNGKVKYLGSIIGIAIGFLMFLYVPYIAEVKKLDISEFVTYQVLFLVPLMLLVWTIVIIRARSFLSVNEGSKLKKLKQYITSSVARDFIGITIFGLCSGALFLILGSAWGYTYLIRHIEQSVYNQNAIDYSDLPIFITAMALIIGVGFASVLSKDFQVEFGAKKDFFTKVIAGILMGFSVGLIPGGNDSLIFYGIPGIAIHAPVALIITMVAIAFVASIKKKFQVE